MLHLEGDPMKPLSNNPFIIAEIGINASGDIKLAKQMIDMAKECGCDAVKFQKRTVEKVYPKELLDSPRESPWGETVRDQKMGLEFDKEEYDIIDAYCQKIGMPWFASAWDLESQEFLKQYDLKYNKIASPMITNLDLLKMVVSEKKHTFISTGMALGTHIDGAVALFKANNCPFTLMHCVSKYPCPDNTCNLKAIPELKAKYDCSVGYSNHSPGILATSLAVLLGAEAIEVHITKDRTFYGSDQAASFEKMGLELLVRDARRVRGMVG